MIATCGNYALGEAVKSALRDSESFDELIDGMRKFIADADDGRMTYAVAGIRNGAPEVWLGSTLDGLLFERRSDRHLGQPPISAHDLQRAFGPISDPDQIAIDDLARGLITLQRECVVWPGFAEPVHLVGGACELGVVTRRGAEVRTVLTWPQDRVGELIKPAPVDWNEWRWRQNRHRDGFAEAPRMSRHDRRAAKARARRAA